MNEKEAQFEQTHLAILDSGQKLFREKGYAATSLRDIMGDAGLTVGGFYAHFESKADLFQACFQVAGEAGAQTVFGGVGPGGFLQSVARYLSLGHVNNKSGGCVLAALLSEIDRFQKENNVALVDGYVGRFVSELVAHGADEESVLGLISLMHGALALARSVRDPQLRDKILAQSLKSAAAFGKAEEKEE